MSQKNKNVKNTEKGTLYIVGTPIGNLGDITLRAIETLKNVDMILAEDTRQTLKLLNHLNIEKHMISYHRHNEDEKIEKVVEYLNMKKDLALVSDAGMPVISDPGQNLVKYLVQNGYNVEVIPGVTALATAIVGSGIDSTRFTFEGFLSINKKQRKARLSELKNETRTMIFYEAPHKILATLKDMKEYLGNRNICVARELTKIHEEYIYTTIYEEIEEISLNGIKGEIVLVIEGISEELKEKEENEYLKSVTSRELVLNEIKNGLDKKEAIKKVAKLKGLNKNDVYKECLELK